MTPAQELLAAALVQNPIPIAVAVGSTGYLDESFLPEQAVSWGSDRFGRSFVTLCLGWPGENDEGEELCVNTLFQRYQADPDYWAVARNIGRTPFPAGSVAPRMLKGLAALIRAGGIVAGSNLWLVSPSAVRTAFAWKDPPRSADQEAAATVHVDRAALIVTDEDSPLGRHPGN